MAIKVSFDAAFSKDDNELLGRLLFTINEMNEKWIFMNYNVHDASNIEFDSYPSVIPSLCTIHFDAIFEAAYDTESDLLDKLIKVVNDMNKKRIVKTYAIQHIDDE